MRPNAYQQHIVVDKKGYGIILRYEPRDEGRFFKVLNYDHKQVVIETTKGHTKKVSLLLVPDRTETQKPRRIINLEPDEFVSSISVQ